MKRDNELYQVDVDKLRDVVLFVDCTDSRVVLLGRILHLQHVGGPVIVIYMG